MHGLQKKMMGRSRTHPWPLAVASLLSQGFAAVQSKHPPAAPAIDMEPPPTRMGTAIAQMRSMGASSGCMRVNPMAAAQTEVVAVTALPTAGATEPPRAPTQDSMLQAAFVGFGRKRRESERKDRRGCIMVVARE